MTLTPVGWLWFIAVALYIASLLLDVLDVLNLPSIYMLTGSMLLLVSGWWVGPSMKELSKEISRRQRRRS
jgi:hypothetical protein